MSSPNVVRLIATSNTSTHSNSNSNLVESEALPFAVPSHLASRPYATIPPLSPLHRQLIPVASSEVAPSAVTTFPGISGYVRRSSVLQTVQGGATKAWDRAEEDNTPEVEAGTIHRRVGVDRGVSDGSGSVHRPSDSSSRPSAVVQSSVPEMHQAAASTRPAVESYFQPWCELWRCCWRRTPLELLASRPLEHITPFGGHSCGLKGWIAAETVSPMLPCTDLQHQDAIVDHLLQQVHAAAYVRPLSWYRTAVVQWRNRIVEPLISDRVGTSDSLDEVWRKGVFGLIWTILTLTSVVFVVGSTVAVIVNASSGVTSYESDAWLILGACVVLSVCVLCYAGVRRYKEQFGETLFVVLCLAMVTSYELLISLFGRTLATSTILVNAACQIMTLTAVDRKLLRTATSFSYFALSAFSVATHATYTPAVAEDFGQADSVFVGRVPVSLPIVVAMLQIATFFFLVSALSVMTLSRSSQQTVTDNIKLLTAVARGLSEDQYGSVVEMLQVVTSGQLVQQVADDSNDSCLPVVLRKQGASPRSMLNLRFREMAECMRTLRIYMPDYVLTDGFERNPVAPRGGTTSVVSHPPEAARQAEAPQAAASLSVNENLRERHGMAFEAPQNTAQRGKKNQQLPSLPSPRNHRRASQASAGDAELPNFVPPAEYGGLGNESIRYESGASNTHHESSSEPSTPTTQTDEFRPVAVILVSYQGELLLGEDNSLNEASRVVRVSGGITEFTTFYSMLVSIPALTDTDKLSALSVAVQLKRIFAKAGGIVAVHHGKGWAGMCRAGDRRWRVVGGEAVETAWRLLSLAPVVFSACVATEKIASARMDWCCPVDLCDLHSNSWCGSKSATAAEAARRGCLETIYDVVGEPLLSTEYFEAVAKIQSGINPEITTGLQMLQSIFFPFSTAVTQAPMFIQNVVTGAATSNDARLRATLDVFLPSVGDIALETGISGAVPLLETHRRIMVVVIQKLQEGKLSDARKEILRALHPSQHMVHLAAALEACIRFKAPHYTKRWLGWAAPGTSPCVYLDADQLNSLLPEGPGRDGMVGIGRNRSLSVSQPGAPLMGASNGTDIVMGGSADPAAARSSPQSYPSSSTQYRGGHDDALDRGDATPTTPMKLPAPMDGAVLHAAAIAQQEDLELTTASTPAAVGGPNASVHSSPHRNPTVMVDPVYAEVKKELGTYNRVTKAIADHREASQWVGGVNLDADDGGDEPFALFDMCMDTNPTDAQENEYIIDSRGRRWRKGKEAFGSGAFASVIPAVSDAGTLAAVKCIDLSAKQITANAEEVSKEIHTLSKLQHENIVSYISDGVVGPLFCIFMECVPAGSLEKLLNRFKTGTVGLPPVAVASYMRDALNGLKYLHANRVVHCDIKPANILITGAGRCKLSDFGSAVNEMLTTTVEFLKQEENRMQHEMEAYRGGGVGNEPHQPSQYDAVRRLENANTTNSNSNPTNPSLMSTETVTTGTLSDQHNTPIAFPRPLPAGPGESFLLPVPLMAASVERAMVVAGPTVATATDIPAGNRNNNSNKEIAAGTPRYMAPEACRGNMSFASDVWSIGITCFELLTGQMPWKPDVLKCSDSRLIQFIGSLNKLAMNEAVALFEDSVDLTPIAHVPHATTFIRLCLTIDPVRRSSVDRLLNCKFLARVKK